MIGIAAAVGVPSAQAATPETPLPSYVTNGDVNAVARSGDRVYLGGSFTYVGPNTGGGAAIDPNTGELQQPAGRIDGSVLAAVRDGDGGWFIGGRFSRVNGVTRSNIAHILADGSVDPAFSPHVKGEVSALAVLGSVVYAGGFFSQVSGPVTRNNAAAFDAATGEVTPWDPDVDGFVRALTVSGSTVYAGGDFFQVNGSVARRNLAAFDATSGAATSWDPSPGGPVYALAVSGSAVYAGGSFTEVNNGSVNRSNLAAFRSTDGTATTWDPNVNGPVRSIAPIGSTVYVGGGFTQVNGSVARNNLAAFTIASSAGAMPWDPNANGPVNALAVSGATIYAGGEFTLVNGSVARNNLAAFDASSAFESTGAATGWQTPPISGPVAALGVSGSTVYAGGSFNSIGGEERNHLAALDASTLALTPWDPDANGVVEDLVISGPTVYAGGGFTQVNGSLTRNRLAAFDASSGAATAWDPDANGFVEDLVISGPTVYAGGYFTQVNGSLARNRLAAFDASSGAATAWDPDVSGPVSALAASGPTIYAGGEFLQVNGAEPRNHLASFNATTGAATTWDPNMNGAVRTLAVSGSTVYAGGEFTRINDPTSLAPGRTGRPRNYLTALDPTTGTFVAGRAPTAPSPVHALILVGSTGYSGGGDLVPVGADRPHLFAFDTLTGRATAWTLNLGGSAVQELANSGATVYAGGSFRSIGSRSQVGFAAFGVPAPTAISPPLITGSALVGQTLSCSQGSWTNDPSGFAFRWLRNGAPIGGQTANGYTVQAGDVGHGLSCRVTATNDTGSGSATTQSVYVPASGLQGAPGASGSPGPQGPAGPQGPPGRDAVVRCVVRKKVRRIRVTCTVKMSTARNVVSARLSRRGHTYAVGRPVVRNGQLILRFRPRRPLARGAYALTVVQRVDGQRVATRSRIRIG